MFSLNAENAKVEDDDENDLNDEWSAWLKESNEDNYLSSVLTNSDLKYNSQQDNDNIDSIGSIGSIINESAKNLRILENESDSKSEKNSKNRKISDKNEYVDRKVDRKNVRKNKKMPVKAICSPIYISTKTIIIHLNRAIDLDSLFWEIPITPYYLPKDGVIKKVMKINSNDKAEYELFQENLKKNPTAICRVLSKNNSTSIRKSKFYNVAKVTIGISKKDILTRKPKETSAFYNCFIILIRVLYEGEYRELHVKIFNTGKMEIPGVKNDKFMFYVLDFMLKNILNPLFDKTKKSKDKKSKDKKSKDKDQNKLHYLKETMHTILINSNFSCNYEINRDKLFDILKYKYNISAIYDPCSYPGIQCKFYYNDDKSFQNGVCECCQPKSSKETKETKETKEAKEEKEEKEEKECKKSKFPQRCSKKGSGSGINQCRQMSFMIFRTGSVLIVGHCDEKILNHVYSFVKNILNTEYEKIGIKNTFSDVPFKKEKKNKNKIIIKKITVSMP